MPIDFGIKIVKGSEKKLRQYPDAIVDVLTDYESIFDDAHDWAIHQAKRNFRTQGKHSGQSSWNYSSEPDYKAYKSEILGEAKPVLRWKGGNEVLHPSLTSKRHPQHVFETSGRSAVFGTSVPYAARLARGGTNQFGETYPGRDPLGVSRGNKVEAMERFIKPGIRDRLKAKGVD